MRKVEPLNTAAELAHVIEQLRNLGMGPELEVPAAEVIMLADRADELCAELIKSIGTEGARHV